MEAMTLLMILVAVVALAVTLIPVAVLIARGQG
jgi:hypothetical protein